MIELRFFFACNDCAILHPGFNNVSFNLTEFDFLGSFSRVIDIIDGKISVTAANKTPGSNGRFCPNCVEATRAAQAVFAYA